MSNSSSGSGSSDLSGLGGVLAPLAAVYVAGSIAAGVAGWFADMYRGIAHLVRGSGTGEMADLEKVIALADLVALAALADGRLDDAENDVMRALMTGEPTFEAELRDAFVRWQKNPAVLRDAAARAASLRASAAKLDDDQRAALRTIVDKLPAHAAPASDPTPYRANANPVVHETMRDELLVALG